MSGRGAAPSRLPGSKQTQPVPQQLLEAADEDRDPAQMAVGLPARQHALAPIAPQAPAGAARFVLDSALSLAVLFAAYRLLHRALALRLVERIAVGTSLTHFGFWRRYRAPRG